MQSTKKSPNQSVNDYQNQEAETPKPNPKVLIFLGSYTQQLHDCLNPVDTASVENDEVVGQTGTGGEENNSPEKDDSPENDQENAPAKEENAEPVDDQPNPGDGQPNAEGDAVKSEEKPKPASKEKKENKSKNEMDSSAMRNNESKLAKSQVVDGEEPKPKDIYDVDHLEPEELVINYTAIKKVLNIDASESMITIDNSMTDSSSNCHVSFWLYFESIEYVHPKNQIQFLGLGHGANSKTLTFAIERVLKKPKGSGPGQPKKDIIANHFIIKFFSENGKRINRMVAECPLKAKKLYFVNFSCIYPENQDFYEFKLTVNGKVEACMTSNERILLNPYHMSVGSDVSSSKFVGEISDLCVITLPWDLKDQKEFYSKYWDYMSGERCKQLVDDNLIQELVHERHHEVGHPKELLREYKYDDQFKETLQEKRRKRGNEEEGEEVMTRMDKVRAAKIAAKQEKEKIKQNVNMFVKEVMHDLPDLYKDLQEIFESRKWIYKSMNMYSPTIDKPKAPKLSFDCLHKKIASLEELAVPYNIIEEALFFRVLGQVCQFKHHMHKVYLIKFAEMTNSLFIDTLYGNYITYDKWLHYLCWADGIRPSSWEEDVEDENAEGEEEEEMPSEDDEGEKNEKDPKDEEIQIVYEKNFFIGDKVALKDKIKTNFAELNDFAEEDTGDVPKMYFENRKLHSFEITHDEDRIRTINFTYLVRINEADKWEDVMAEFEEFNNGNPPEGKEVDPKAKKDDKKKTGLELSRLESIK